MLTLSDSINTHCRFSALVLILLTAGACTNTPSDEANNRQTASGYQVIHHTSNNGDTPDPGDLMVYDEVIYRNDTALWRSSIKFGRPQERIMPASGDIENALELAWFEALSMMSAGDSLTLFQSLDTFSNLPLGLSPSDKLTCHFRMISVTPKAELRASIDRIINDQTLPRTPSGYVFILHRDEAGPTAQVGDKVSYHEQAFRTGVRWYSTYDLDKPREAVLPDKAGLPAPVPPSYECLLMMSPGDSATVYQPLAEYDNLPPTLSKDGVLVFSLKLLSVMTPEQQEQQAQEVQKQFSVIEKITQAALKDYLQGTLKGLKQLPSGLEYVVLEEGSGPSVVSGAEVDVTYAGFLQTNGAMFDNSIGRATPLSFVAGKNQVIDGFDEGVSQLRVGSKAILFIPSSLGYGAQERPAIPPNSDLAFYIEVLNVKE